MKRLMGVVAVVLLAVLGACSRTPPPVVAPTPPVVSVVSPRTQPVTDYLDFTGRAKASDTVDIKARVTGYLQRIAFTDGGTVAADQLMFEIEPGTYETDLNRAKAAVKQAEANEKLAAATLKRVEDAYNLVRNLDAESRERRLEREGQWEEAKAGVLVAREGTAVAKAQLAQAQRLFDYTKVNAPKDARVGRRLIDRGALVKADETILATLVVTDPMHVYFDVDDRTLLRLNRLRADGKLQLTGNTLPAGRDSLVALAGGAASGRSTRVQLGLPDQEGFPDSDKGGFVGTIDFVDTQLTATTGTITLRAEVPNPKGVLAPNLFVRVRLPLGDPRPRVLVPEQCIYTDQGLKHVWVVNAKDEAEYRQVNVGLQVGTDVVVEPVPGKANSGVAEGDRVIVEGGQRVKKDTKVTVRSGQ